MAIFSAAAALIGGALGLGAVATSVIAAGLSVAAQLAVSYFTRQQGPTPNQDKRVAFSQQVQFGANVPRFAVYGTAAVKGHLHYWGKWGKGDRYNGFVYKLSDGWCDGLEPEVYFYGEKHTLVSATPIGGETQRWKVSGFDDLIEFRFYDGRPGQTADAQLVSETSSAQRRWSSTDRMTNQAYVVVVLEFDKDAFERGRPEFTFVLRGLRAYDWRKDGSVAGGVGDHRFNDPVTWEHTTNPAILRAAFQLGLQGTVSGRTLIGQGKTFAQLHLPSYTVAANVADTDRTKGGRTFKIYQCGMVIDADMDHTEVLSDFDDAVAGYRFDAGGLAGIIVGAPQIPAFAITANDIRMDATKSVRNRRDTDALYNHLTGDFMSRESHWKPEPLKPVTVAADVSADKRKRSLAYDFTQVFDPDVAQYLLNIRYRQGRFGGQATIPVMPRLYRTAEAGDWCTWDNRTWLVTNKADGNLTLAQTDASVYSETDIAVGPIVTAPAVPTGPTPVELLQNFACTPGVETSSNGQSLPTLVFTWDATTDPRVDSVIIEYRLAGSSDATRIAVANVDEVTRHVVRDGILAGQLYEFRHTLATDPPRTAIWTTWGVVTTDNSWTVPDASVDLSRLTNDIQVTLTSAQTLVEANRPQPDWEADFIATVNNALEQVRIVSGLADAGIEIDPAKGEVGIFATNPVDNQRTNIEALFSAQQALIQLSATTTYVNDYVNDTLASALAPAYTAQFDTGLDGWVGTNSTLSQSGSIMTVTNTGADAEAARTGLSIDADTAPRLTVRLRRSAGSDATWPAAFSFDAGSGYVTAIALPEPADQSVLTTVELDLSGNPDWSGTVDKLKILTGGAGEAFEIDTVQIGLTSPLSQDISQLQARVTAAELSIDANAGEIASRVTNTQFGTFTDRVDGSGDIVAVGGNVYTGLAQTSTTDALQVQIDQVQQTQLADASGATIHDLAESVRGFVTDLDFGVGQLTANGVQALALARASDALSTRITEDGEATAQRILDLETQIAGDITASLTQLEQTVANDTSALATSITNLSAQFQADLNTETTARTNAIAAEAATRTAELAVVNQAIADETSARTTAVSSLTTTVDGNTASLSTLQSSVDGVELRFGVLGTINGVTGGFQFTGVQRLDGVVSYTLEIDGDLIVDGTITADKLQATSLSAINANLGIITAGRLQSADGNMVIDLDNKIFRMTK